MTLLTFKVAAGRDFSPDRPDRRVGPEGLGGTEEKMKGMRWLFGPPR
jgi:hypothetical protein